MTCHADFDYARKALQLGSCDYLLKPVLYEEMEEVLRKNFECILRKRSNQEDMESFKKYYSIEEKWKVLLSSEEQQGAEDLISLTLGWIKDHNDQGATLIKVHQSILQIAVYALNTKGMTLDKINSLESSFEVNDFPCTEGQFVKWLQDIIATICTGSALGESELPENGIVYELQKYIQQNLSQRLTRDELSEHVYLNGSYLSRLFHKETGMSLSDYILQERMKKAEELIV